MKISIVPQGEGGLGGTLLEPTETYDPLQPFGVDRAFFSLLAQGLEGNGHEVGTVDQLGVDEADAVFFVGLRSGLSHYLQAVEQSDRPLLFYYTREPPVYSPIHSEKRLVKLRDCFDRIFTWNDGLSGVDGIETVHWPISESQLERPDHDRTLPFDDHPLFTNVSSMTSSSHPEELYSERKRIVEYYEANHPDEFSLYGRGWGRDPTATDICAGRWQIPEYEVYQGPIDDKAAGYRSHRFALCFENMTGVDGWISEKIFDVFAAGRIPVYWGASNVTEYIPSSTFVDYRDFGSPADLHEHLTSIDEAEYRKYLDAIDEFLEEAADPFRASAVATDVRESILEVADSDAEGRRRDIDPSFVRELADRNVFREITYANVAAESARAFVDPPAGVTRGDIVRMLGHVAYGKLRSGP